MEKKFAPFTSSVAPGFWKILYDRLLEQANATADKTVTVSATAKPPVESTDREKTANWGINVEPSGITLRVIPIWGYYGPATFRPQSQLLTVDHTSFNENPTTNIRQFAARGKMLMTNSLQDFKDINYNELIANNCSLAAIEKDSSELISFIILTYGDLKQYSFTYWFGFPTISSVQLKYSLPSDYQLYYKTDAAKSVFEKYPDIIKLGFFAYDVKGQTLKSLDTVAAEEDVQYCFIDPSGTDEVPGWPVRNYAVYLRKKLNLTSGSTLRILSIRPKLTDAIGDSTIFEFNFEFPKDFATHVKILGWEKSDGKFGPQIVDLKSNFDPVTLSETSVDFNLKLMKWRLFPEFDLQKMHNLKVCLLGAGTLGCNVARCLMGWGVRNIQLIDGSRISYSNPVRQSLYKYDDCGKPKAETAAQNLKAIFPGVQAVGHRLFVPMPGHPPITLERTMTEFAELEQIIKDSDVIYLLTDTRESRWLPTLLGMVHDKLVVNAALGFDSYVVMRHGRKGEDLGCYFCTDIVVPGNSTIDRTLDQQCTVSRPGVSMIAGALAVELMVSVLHYTAEKGDGSTTLGVPAHTLRGFLSSGQYISPSFHRFDKCSACSEKVIKEFKKSGIELVLQVMKDPKVLEKLTGLDELGFGIDGIMELSDDDDENGDGEELNTSKVF